MNTKALVGALIVLTAVAGGFLLQERS